MQPMNAVGEGSLKLKLGIYFMFLVVISIIGIVTGTVARSQSKGEDKNHGVETVATLPSAGATEGLCETSDGSFYVTGIDDQILWKVDTSGKVEKFATVPTHIMVPLLTKDGFIATARQRTAPRTASADGGIHFDFSGGVGTEVIVVNKTGKLEGRIPGPDGAYFNGMDDTGHGFYVIADTAGPNIWRLNLAKKRIELWLKDDQLSSPADAKVNIGGNGLKVHGDWVYIAVSSRNAIYRVQMDSKGNPKGALKLFAQGFGPDDFDITKDGTIFLPSGTSIYKISPAGEVSKFLDGVPGGAASRISRDGKWMYWPTRGGSEPQRLLRVPIQ